MQWKTLTPILAALALTATASADSSKARAPRAPTAPDFGDDAPREHRRDDLATSDGQRKLEPFAVLLFQFNSDKLSRADEPQLAEAAKWLEDHPRELLVIEGYADTTGSREYNAALSSRRAEAVSRRLTQYGVAQDRIVIGSFGEALARSPNPQANRRVIVRGTRDHLDQVISRTVVDGDQRVVWTYQPRTIATRE